MTHTGLVMFGFVLLVGGLLVPLVSSAVRYRGRRRDEEAFWEQVRHRPGLFDWSEFPDL